MRSLSSLWEDLFRNVLSYVDKIRQVSECLVDDLSISTFSHTNMSLICIEPESLKIALLCFQKIDLEPKNQGFILSSSLKTGEEYALLYLYSPYL